MKKILYAVGVFASLMAVSCVKETFETPSAENGTRIRFVGDSYDAATKVSIGEKDGDKYPLLWQAGDAICVWSPDLRTEDLPSVDADGNPVAGTAGKIFGEKAELYAETAGKTSGTFLTANPINVTGDTDVLITYPGTATFIDGVISSEIGYIQTQRGASSSLHVGNNALAFANATLKATETDAVTFTLEQQTAFVKLTLTTSEYLSYKLKSAKIIATGETLSGTMKTTVADKSFTVENGKDYVGAKFRTPVDFSGEQTLYFSAIPADLTGKKVIVSVEMTDAEGIKTVTVPTTVDGGKLAASCLSVINVNVSSASLSEYKWYEPVETRDLLNGWAYGTSNTHYIEQKADADNTIVFDVKARGDFSRVKEPKYYLLYTGKSEMPNNRGLCFLPGEIEDKDTFVPVNEDYTITVGMRNQSAGTGRWAVVAIYGEDKTEVLWSFMICKYLEGDPIKDITYPNGTVMMDRAIGSTYSNSLAEENGTFDLAGAYFPWGRKDPAMWSNSGLTPRYDQQDATSCPDIAHSIKNPGIKYSYVDGSAGDWKTDEHSGDLWGGNNETGVGHKTIYDPCPKGYRVPDPAILDFVQKNSTRWETYAENHKVLQEAEDAAHQVINENSPFNGKFSALAIVMSGTDYDYWPYGGARWGNKTWGNRTSTTNCSGALYWSNAPVENSNQSQALQVVYSSSSFGSKFAGANKSQGFLVRCQKDTENR